MEFKKITLGDIDRLKPFFPYADGRTCDYSVGGVFIWRDFFRMEYCIEDNVLYSRLHDPEWIGHYNLPLAEDIPSALLHLLAELKPTLAQVRFTTVPEPYLPMFKELCDIVFIAEQREYMDYLYSAEELANLSGRKFHGQKNLVNAFIRENPDWSFEAIGPENLPEVRAFFEADYQSDKDLPPSGQEEELKTFEVLDNLDLYGFQGWVLKAAGQVLGFTLGEVIGDTCYAHTEKADRNRKGAYQMVFHQFAKQLVSQGVTYINREDDMGDLGLRTAKLALHPVDTLKKYMIEVRT